MTVEAVAGKRDRAPRLAFVAVFLVCGVQACRTRPCPDVDRADAGGPASPPSVADEDVGGQEINVVWAGLRLFLDTSQDFVETLRLVDREGAVRYVIEDDHVTDIRLQDLTGDGQLELWVISDGGGSSECSHEDHVLTADEGGPRAIFEPLLQCGRIDEVTSLDGVGPPELITNFVEGLENPGEGRPGMRIMYDRLYDRPVVLSWDGSSLRDVTSRHGRYLSERVEEARAEVLLQCPDSTCWSLYPHLSFLAAAMVAGTEEQALQWLRANLGTADLFTLEVLEEDGNLAGFLDDLHSAFRRPITLVVSAPGGP